MGKDWESTVKPQWDAWVESQIQSRFEIKALRHEGFKPTCVGEGARALFTKGDLWDSWKPAENNNVKKEPRPLGACKANTKEAVVMVHVGGAGCGMGMAYWRQLNQEHRLKADGSPDGELFGEVAPCYHERNDGAYVPRA